MKYITKPKLMAVAELWKVYFTQDSDGFVQIWTRKPKRNLELGIWEGCDAPILNQAAPLLAPYTKDWERSLITPRSRKLTNETWQEWLSEQGENND